MTVTQQPLLPSASGSGDPTSVTLRTCGLPSTVSSADYMEAVRGAFGVTPSPALTDSLRQRGFFHFQIPQDVAATAFTAADTVDFCHQARWSLRVRSKDRDGKPYQSWGKRSSDVPSVSVAKVPKAAAPTSTVVAPNFCFGTKNIEA